MTKDKYLFQEFSSVSAKEWKHQIQMELKGADYNETLVWQSLEGISVKPFYHAEDFEYLEIPNLEKDFKIGQRIFIDEPEIANKIAVDAVSKGVDFIFFIAKQSFDIDVLFQGFENLSVKPFFFIDLQFLSLSFINSLFDYSKIKDLSIKIDSIGHLARTGKWYQNQEIDFNNISELLSKNTNRQILSIDVSIYQNAGANIIQQIAYALSHATEYLSMDVNDEIKSIQFDFSVGSNYFFEIAKLRAFRYLWKELMLELNLEIPITLMVEPSRRNKTLYDNNVNMLRTTTEYMSAIIGGADVVLTQAYDSIFKKSNEFSERIAKNQLLVLKEESGFKNAGTFAKGSYYIESLTLEIVNKALQLYKEIEKQGGFLSSLKSGIIQRKIKESAQKEQDLFDCGKRTLLGTNKYPNKEDRMNDNLELFPFIKHNKQQITIQPIIAKRLAQEVEQQRLKTEEE
jgi:methylmalonyl-CoA mutase